ncbi:MAG: hypothetical protein M8860_06085 [marine benthic group bacterium]|nr:hypothetical protein [Gemmatimonadota bacterium]MCL7962404.1 hypothetical protein [Candidatus Carthagonibacter metallireducens]MCL7986218.1 hypothetical protein [Gemmatimonadota bacterium]MCL7991001.1 hypothetical protein [Gemmatimonadota bacterium]
MTDRVETHRVAYLAVTGLVAAVGGVTAIVSGVSAAGVTAGLALAWAVQAASFWPLAGALEAGRPVTNPWVAGMAARFGGLALLWGLSALLGRGRNAVLAYAFALVTYLLLEAVWLALTARSASPDEINQ